ncbi:Lim1, partial [Operophtera brumata]
VWFQNKRSKERRLKQLTSMGRGPFFGSSRKMRGFPMNLSPGGLEEGPPGFPYFATADGKFEFGYGPPFHHDAPFFHPPPSMPSPHQTIWSSPGRLPLSSPSGTDLLLCTPRVWCGVKYPQPEAKACGYSITTSPQKPEALRPLPNIKEGFNKEINSCASERGY